MAGAQHNEDAHTASRMCVELLFPAPLPGIFDAIWSVALLRCAVARHLETFFINVKQQQRGHTLTTKVNNDKKERSPHT